MPKDEELSSVVTNYTCLRDDVIIKRFFKVSNGYTFSRTAHKYIATLLQSTTHSN